MAPMKIVGIVLIVAGIAALAYGGFSYTKETHKAEIGPLKLSVQEKEQVNVPQWSICVIGTCQGSPRDRVASRRD